MVNILLPASIEQQLKRIKTAQEKLVRHPKYRFFGSTLSRPLIPATEDEGVDTFATDGENIFFNPDFAAQCTMDELQGVLAHEDLHVKLGHNYRIMSREHKLFNRAADYAINPIVIDSGLKIPSGGLVADRFRNKSTEMIYGILFEEMKKQLQKNASKGAIKKGSAVTNMGGQGSYRDPVVVLPAPGAKGMTDKQIDRKANERIEKTKRELQDHKKGGGKDPIEAFGGAGCGDMPGSLDAVLAKYEGKQKQDWKTELMKFAVQSTRTRYNWNLFNRAYAAMGIYLPVKHSKEVRKAALVLDTSGSMDERQLARLSDQIEDIVATCDIGELHYFQVDTRIAFHKVYEDGEQPPRDVKGGGGTDFRPAFSKIEKDGTDLGFLIYFTDGDCSSFAKQPDYPVVWVLQKESRRFKPPYGDVIVMDN